MVSAKGLASDAVKMKMGIAPNNGFLRGKFYLDRMMTTIKDGAKKDRMKNAMTGGSFKIITVDDYARAKEKARQEAEQKMADANARKSFESEALLPRREVASRLKQLIDFERSFEIKKGTNSIGIKISKNKGKAQYEDALKGMAIPFEDLVTYALEYRHGIIGPTIEDKQYKYRTFRAVNENKLLKKGVDTVMNLIP